MCLTRADGYSESCTDDLSSVLGEPGSGRDTYTKSVTLQWVALRLSSWEWLQIYQDTGCCFKSGQGDALHCSWSCVPKHTCSRMQINIAHQNTFWKETLLDWDWPCCWKLIPTAVRQQQPGHSVCQCTSSPHENSLCYSFPQTQPRTFRCVKGRSQVQLLSGWLLTGQGLQASVWIRLTKGASKNIILRGCCQGIAVRVYLTPVKTPAVSCSLLELKHALFTLTTALKGKIKIDFEVVEFTHWFCFLQVCGIELWASELC